MWKCARRCSIRRYGNLTDPGWAEPLKYVQPEALDLLVLDLLPLAVVRDPIIAPDDQVAFIGFCDLKRDAVTLVVGEGCASGPVRFYAVHRDDARHLLGHRVRDPGRTAAAEVALARAVGHAKRREQAIHIHDLFRFVVIVPSRRHHAASGAHPARKRGYLVVREHVVQLRAAGLAGRATLRRHPALRRTARAQTRPRAVGGL